MNYIKRSRTEMLSLLEQETHIILDNCVLAPPYSEQAKELYEMRSIRSMTDQFLSELEKTILRMGVWFDNPKSIILPEVYVERESYVNLLTHKLHYFSNRTDSDHIQHYMRYYELVTAAEKKINEAQEKIRRFNGTYQELCTHIIELTKDKKRGWIREQQFSTWRKKKHADLHTDEKIVAASLHLSLNERKKNAIYTADTDLCDILYVASYQLMQDKPESIQLLRDHPLRLYHETRNGAIEIRFDSSELC